MKLLIIRKIVWVLSRLLVPAVLVNASYRVAERRVARWVREDAEKGNTP
jgi:hypothetical protein